MVNTQLLDLLDKTLQRMAGGRPFSRGQDYFKDGRVHSLFNDAELLEATVIGSRKYRVQLWVEEDRVSYSCTCPVGEDGDFCKHCVAVALAGKSEPPRKNANGKDRKTRALTLQDVRAIHCWCEYFFTKKTWKAHGVRRRKAGAQLHSGWSLRK